MAFTIEKLLEKNSEWAGKLEKDNPGFFSRLTEGQSPRALFIGCSDSRVPLALISGAGPGDLFIHRNVANQIHLSDKNTGSVLQFAILNLKVEWIIICGHTGCGGATGALKGTTGMLRHWLRPLSRKARKEKIIDPDVLAEKNVLFQMQNLQKHPVMRKACKMGIQPGLKGMFFNMATGLLKEVQKPS